MYIISGWICGFEKPGCDLLRKHLPTGESTLPCQIGSLRFKVYFILLLRKNTCLESAVTGKCVYDLFVVLAKLLLKLKVKPSNSGDCEIGVNSTWKWLWCMLMLLILNLKCLSNWLWQYTRWQHQSESFLETISNKSTFIKTMNMWSVGETGGILVLVVQYWYLQPFWHLGTFIHLTMSISYNVYLLQCLSLSNKLLKLMFILNICFQVWFHNREFRAAVYKWKDPILEPMSCNSDCDSDSSKCCYHWQLVWLLVLQNASVFT